jgi:hypothetical protein
LIVPLSILYLHKIVFFTRTNKHICLLSVPDTIACGQCGNCGHAVAKVVD